MQAKTYFTLLKKQSSLLLLLPLFIAGSAVAQRQVNLLGRTETIYPVSSNNISSTDDLLCLKNIFQDKEVIGMGEATHGTKEFFNLKSKMFIYLVQQLQVKVFSIEASYSGCLFLNDYVLYGIGNLDSVMRKLEFWTWQTEEVKQLIAWIRTFNQDKEENDKISFYGFDMQSFNAPLSYLYNYIKNNHTEDAPDFLKIISSVYNREPEIYKTLYSKNRDLIIDSLERVYAGVYKWFSKKEPDYNQGSSDKKYQQIKLCIQNFKESVLNVKNNGNRRYFRDSCMASNILQIKAIENCKVFVWAHNEHIKKMEAEGSYPSENKTMGSYLKTVLGERYYAIGFLFHQGSFLAVKGQSSLASKMFSRYILSRKFIKTNLAACNVGPSPAKSIASIFSKFNQPSFFINITGSNNQVFTTRQIIYSVGAVFMNRRRSLLAFIPSRRYDGLFFINNTSASHLLTYKR